MLPKRPTAHDYCVLAADINFRKSVACFLFFTRLVPDCIYLTLPTINFHPSLLPEHSGLAGYASAISAQQLAVSAHLVDSTIDGGKVLRQYLLSPFPGKATDLELRQESSLICSAAILSILRALPLMAAKNREDFSSGTHCVNSILFEEVVV